MNKTAIGTVVIMAAITGGISGYALSRPPVVHTVIRVVNSPPRTVTEWRFKTVTKTVIVYRDTDTVTCFPYEGRAYLASPGVGIGSINGCTLSIQPVLPMSMGEVSITVIAPDGSNSTITAPEG